MARRKYVCPETLAFWEALDATRHRPERGAVMAPATAPAPPAPPPAPEPNPEPAPVKAKSPARKSTRARRTCLSCSKPFNSSGPGNRRCSSCRRHDAFADNITEYSVCPF